MEVQKTEIDAEALLKGFLKALLEEQSPHYAPARKSDDSSEVRDGE